MAQYPKPEVRDRIHAAALRVFAARGYPDAGMAEIAREAGVSAGNVYHYAESKEALFHAVVPEALVRTFLRLLTGRVHALSGVADIAGAGAGYARASEALLAFCVAHRLEMIVLLGKGEGTPYTTLAEDVVQMLADLALAYFRALRPGAVPDPAARFELELIYRAYLRSLVAILERDGGEAVVRRAVEGYARYHLAGLRAFFSAT
jgi:AcrR family transcriptional regulator